MIEREERQIQRVKDQKQKKAVEKKVAKEKAAEQLNNRTSGEIPLQKSLSA